MAISFTRQGGTQTYKYKYGGPPQVTELVELRRFRLHTYDGITVGEVDLYVRYVPGFPGTLDHCDANRTALIKTYGRDSYFDRTWQQTGYNWHSVFMSVSPNEDMFRDISIDMTYVGCGYWFDPKKRKQPKIADGTCPQCGAPGEFIRMALCCPRHGAFGGM